MLKKLGIFLLVTFAGGLILAYYYWRQLTRVPQWYATQESQSALVLKNPADFANLQANQSEIIQKVDQQFHERHAEAKLSEQDVNRLIVTRIAEKPEGQKLLTVIQGVNTNIEKDKLEIGAVVNSQNFQDSSRLNDAEKRVLTQIIKEFPLLKDQEIYVGFESKPQVQDGQIKIDETAKIKIGELSFTLKEVADRLGISSEQLVEKINQNLDILPASEVQFEDNELLLRQ
jgi:AraC-like DNA-binding protein